MRWLWLVGSLKLQVFFAEHQLFYKALLQKRPIILRSLLIVATPYVPALLMLLCVCAHIAHVYIEYDSKNKCVENKIWVDTIFFFWVFFGTHIQYMCKHSTRMCTHSTRILNMSPRIFIYIYIYIYIYAHIAHVCIEYESTHIYIYIYIYIYICTNSTPIYWIWVHTFVSLTHTSVYVRL